MDWRTGVSLQGSKAVLATMHAKESVISPLIERFLGCSVEVARGVDTDAFGTFSRDIERAGNQLEAARAKIEAGFQHVPSARIGLSSEGSFGPHHFIPFFASGREIVVMRDRISGFELIGHDATLDTNFQHEIVASVEAGQSFAKRIGFPGHGVILIACADGKPVPDIALHKDVTSWEQLGQRIGAILDSCGAAFVEADMRAHRNPRRMRAIKRATLDLIRKSRSQCPKCHQPGFSVTERLPGLPCSWCRQPTSLVKTEVMICAGCCHRSEQAVQAESAEPGNCNDCNP